MDPVSKPNLRRPVFARLRSAAGAAASGVFLGVAIDVAIAAGELMTPGGIVYGLGLMLPGSTYFIFLGIPTVLALFFAGAALWDGD